MFSKGSVFVIGLDGATFDLLDPLMDAGVMPNLQHLIQAGSSGVLRSTVPPVTAPAWASFQTGTNPGKHGIVDFLRYQPGSYEPVLVDARAIQGQTLWSILSAHQRRMCVMNVPLTYPPQPVLGYLISGFLTPSTDVPFTYPRELREQLLAHVPGYVIAPAVDIVTSGTLPFVKALQHTVERRWQAARWLIEQGPWDLFMVHFQATDVLQHALWDCLDPTQPGFSAYSAAERESVRQFYRTLDSIIGDLVQRADGATVVVMSDHGFGPARRRVYLNRWLVNQGYMALRASELWTRTQAGLENLVKTLDVLNLRRRWLPRDFIGQRGNLIRQLTQSPWIEWARTRAFLFSGSTFGNLYVNRAGRDPLGMVTESEYERLRTTLIECFQMLVDPDMDQPVVEQTYRREEVFAGPMMAELPDLIVRPQGGYLLETRFKGTSLFGPLPQGLTGLHRLDGMCVFTGGAFVTQPQRPVVNLVDLAPTILYLLGIPVPDWMDGRALVELFDAVYQPAPEQPALAGRPPVEQPALVQGTAPQGYSSDEEAQVVERLRRLGYL